MIRTLRSLALSTAAVLVLGAVSAAAAQAEAEHGTWHLNNAVLPFAQGEALNTSINSAKAKLKVSGLLELEGTAVASTEAAISGPYYDEASAITFTNVTVVGAEACHVHSPGAENHTVATHAVATYLVKEAGTWWEIFIPSAGTNHPFVTVDISECALAGEYNVTGSSVGKVLSPETEAATHVLEFPSPHLTTTFEGVEFGTLHFGSTHTAELEVKTNETVATSGHTYSAH